MCFCLLPPGLVEDGLLGKAADRITVVAIVAGVVGRVDAAAKAEGIGVSANAGCTGPIVAEAASVEQGAAADAPATQKI